MSDTAESAIFPHAAETVSSKATTEPATVAPTTSASADTDIIKPAIVVDDEVPAVAWYQCACAEASLDKAAASSAKADVNRLGGGAAMRSVFTKATRMWDNGSTLTYTFLAPKAGNVIQQDKVKTVVQEWEKYANVKFTFVATGNATIRITFDTTSGSWSYVGNEVGRIKPNAATMNLGWIGSSSTTITADEKGVILHEFGHTLGLMHEHQSPVRGGTITLKESAVIQFYKKTQGWTEQEVRQQILDVYNVSDVSNFSALDVKSIMMYFMPAAMNEQNLEIKPNNVLSDIDKAFMTINYPYPSTRTPADSIWTMDYALGVAGVDAETKAAILVQYGLSEWPEVRYLFSHFSISARRADSIKPLQVIPSTNGVVDVPTAAKAASTESSGKFLEVIVNSLKQVFAPTTGQCFAFQFPGRFLQKDLYAWDTSAAGIYGQFIKPTVVNESEFRLVDQLYNVGEVIGAPNGQNLSICYEQVLNNLVPGHENDSRVMAKQQDQIRRWLMKGVPAAGWVKDLIESQHSRSASLSAAVGSTKTPDGEPVPQFAVANKLSEDGRVNRMELAEALMEEYLSAKQVWELERDTMIKNARARNEDMEDTTRKLAHITAIREAQLAAKHADAVVRGYSHTIRQYLGYMDIKSPSEMLQEAKDALREAATRSFDGAMKIYPVQMMPNDWFQSLSTSFTMEDLTSNADVIHEQINNKSKLLDLLQARLAALQLSPKNNLKALKLAAEEAQSEYSKHQSNLQKTYTSNVISLAQSFISAANEFQYTPFVDKAKVLNIAATAYTGIEESMKKATAAHDAVNSASRAYSQALSAVTLAEATDTAQETTRLTLQADAIRKEIAELTTRVQVLRANPAVPENTPKLADVPLFPPPPSGTAGGGRWQEITLTHHTSNIRQATMTKVGSSVSSSDSVSLFWGSKKQTTTSSAEDYASFNSESFKIDIGFRTTMVTVDRGGWFQPQFFKQSSGFYHIDKKIFAAKWPEGITSMEDLRNAKPAQWEELNKGLLPAYPVGFIICKDITIKVNMSAEQVSNRSKEFEESVQSSSGIFCWPNSSGSSHDKTSERVSDTVSASDGVIIRIPGPHILGYILQYVENDLTEDLKADLPADFLIPDADYEAVFNDTTKPQKAPHAPVADPSTDIIPAAATTAVTSPKDVPPPSRKEEPVYSSGYYFAPKLRV